MSAPHDDMPGEEAQREPLEITAEMLAPVEPRPAGPRDFERGMSYVPLVTLLLIAANVAAYVWEVGQIGLVPQSEQAYVDVGALYRPAVLAGQVWRPFSAMFLHGGIDHLLGNLFMLYVLGMGCEHAFGWGKTLAMYLAAGLGGAVASLAWQPGPSVGASGAIFGLAGILIAFFRRHRDVFFIRDKRIGVVLLLWSLYTVAIGLVSPEIDNACHVGGLLTGLLLGSFVPMKPVDPLEGKERAFFVRI
jgi:rhomboid protease GluP